jgi:hypothetical protein
MTATVRPRILFIGVCYLLVGAGGDNKNNTFRAFVVKPE